jgi:glycosyltransferase involved in cell wall biosynthesis
MSVLFLASTVDLPELWLFCELASNGVELHVAGEPHPYAASELARLSIPVYPLKVRHRFDRAAGRVISTIVDTHHIQIVHALSAKALTTTLLSLGKRKDLLIAGYRGIVGNLSRLSPLSWLSYLHPRVDLITCASRDIAHFLSSQGIPDRKIFPIYKGHNISWYESREPSVHRKELGIPEHLPLIGAIATFRPRKGGAQIVDAFNQLHALHECALLIVGDIDDPLFTKAISDSPYKHHIFAVGNQKEAFRFARICTCTVTASLRREGLPKAVVESMALGVPVVVTKVGGMNELVTDEVTGLSVAAGDSAALRDALLRTLTAPKDSAQRAVAAKHRIASEFSVESHTRGLLDAYGQIRERKVPSAR